MRKAPAVKKAAGAKTAAARRRSAPVFPTVTDNVLKAVVDQVPAPYSTNPRTTVYARVMREIREQVGPGKAVAAAEFVGRAGAASVKKALEAGERPIDGRVGDWVIDARRNPETGGSVLYFTLKR